MKTPLRFLRYLVSCFLIVGFATNVNGQFLKKLGKAAERAAERTVERRVESETSKKTDAALDSILEPGTGKKEPAPRQDAPPPPTPSGDSSDKEGDQDSEIISMKAWSKYNFVPGDKIIFHDDLSGEESGEFPSRWDLLKGNAENASMGTENVINMLHQAKITPLMDEKTYLPEVFTIEFDAFFQRVHGPTYQDYYINLWPGSKPYGYSEDGNSYCGSITLNMNGAALTCHNDGDRKNYETYERSMEGSVGEPIWRHIAIAFNKRSLKLFIDEKRVLNIPNLDYKPEAFSISVHAVYGEHSAMKNIRIAEGGKKLYDRVMADGKFVTRGILFDVNKATIKPESMGVINEVAKMMKEHQELSFSIEGHTDSDGAEDYNLDLSSQRAESVKAALVQLGISSEKFQTKGWGESVPMEENTTPEGKANNRRVEFIKI